MQYELINNEQKNRYEYQIGDEVAIAEYIIRDNKIYIVHIEVPQDLQNQGIAAKLTEDVMRDIEKKGYKLVPVCPYAVVYVKRHPEWQKLC